MKKEALLIPFLIAIALFTACEKIDVSKLSDTDLQRISKELIVCNKPYIRYASECCLDKNDNSICDKDEGEKITKETPSGITPPVTETPAQPTHPETPVGKETEKVDGMCEFPSGIKCIDFKVNSVTNAVILVLENSFGYDLSSSYVSVTACNRTMEGYQWKNNEVRTFDLNRCDPSLLNVPVYKSDITIQYGNATKWEEVHGSLVTKVERKNIEEKCTFQSGIYCTDYKITPTNIQVRLLNGLGRTILPTTFSAEGCGTLSSTYELVSGSSATFTIVCNPQLSGTKYDGKLTFTYTEKDTQLTKTATGQLTARITQ